MLRPNFSERRPLWQVFLSCYSITTLALPATGATASDLMEKAIYAEETVGDLDEAIQIYQQVLAETKRSIDAAGQAQFRIGTCYARQGKAAEAALAYQAVIDHYPGAVVWVAQARSRLPGAPELLPAPWVGRRRRNAL